MDVDDGSLLRAACHGRGGGLEELTVNLDSVSRLKTTFRGITSCVVGKSDGICSAPIHLTPRDVVEKTAGSGGRCAVAPRNTMMLLSPVNAGVHSSPVPGVSTSGAARSIGTRTMWRRSMS